MTVTTRFAPSPTGHLHLGHAYSALFACRLADAGHFVLRIEDIDPVRCDPAFTQAIFDDLSWLGLKWDTPVRLQSEHLNDYRKAFATLRNKDLLYPCFCTRKTIALEVALSASARHSDETILTYPGTCRALSPGERLEKLDECGGANWRLDLAKAQRLVGEVRWNDSTAGDVKATPEILGDVVVARKDIETSYHLSVTVDDHLQDISLVTRGQDLFDATHIQIVLQKLLGYETPHYAHHRLLLDERGKRYAKRDASQTLASLRSQGLSRDDVFRRIGIGV